jgi:ABC-2 type transport system permease protein
VKLKLALRKIMALFLRDLATARSYRIMFVFQLVEALFGVAAFYYLSRFIESPQLSSELPRGSSYFAFALVGFVFFDYLGMAINVFDQSIEDARQNGTLEYLLVTQTSLPVILIGSMLYPFVILAFRTTIYIGWGILLFGFPARQANWLGAAAVLTASVLGFAGLGLLSSSYMLLFKRGNPAKWFFLGVAGLVSGIMYPVSVLPKPLQLVARFFPVTYSLTGMRAAVLQNAPIAALWPSIRALLLFAAVLLPLSFAVFSWALRRTKVTGTLTHF